MKIFLVDFGAMNEIKRDFSMELARRLAEPDPLVQAVIGPRQVGKTTGVKQVLAEYDAPSLYESADGAGAFGREWLLGVWQRGMRLPPGGTLVIDEIQKVDGWQDALKDLWDNHRARGVRVVVLGSSSLEIQQGLKESLAGRYELVEVRHWGLSESRALDPSIGLEQYLLFGGYPGGYRFRGTPRRWQGYIRDSILENVLDRDILRLRPLPRPALFRQFLELLSAYPCREISYTKLLGNLQDRGNVEVVKHYLFLLSCAFLYRGLEKYAAKETIRKSSSPKILPLCPALCTRGGPMARWNDPDERGRLFETAVGAALARADGDLFYWRDGADEVDFVFESDRLYAIEVKSGRKRRAGGLTAFLSRFPRAVPVVVAPEDYEIFDRNPGAFLSAL